MSLEWRVVPIEKWPDDVELEDRFSPFRKANGRGWMDRGANWSDTMDKLERELRHLEAENVVLQMAVRDRDIRNDGWIRANAKPNHPGIILTFDSTIGPMSYPCGAFREWQSNLRAIAVTLENLRRIDRYGVSGRGQQYTGWKQIPGAGQTGATMTTKAAAEVLVRLEHRGGEAEFLLDDALATAYTYRNAAKLTHPDRGGSVHEFQLLQEAKAVLDAHHG